MCVTGVACDLITGEVYEEYDWAMQQLLAMADAIANSFADFAKAYDSQFGSLADCAIRLPDCNEEQQTEAVGIPCESPAHVPFCACHMRRHSAATGT